MSVFNTQKVTKIQITTAGELKISHFVRFWIIWETIIRFNCENGFEPLKAKKATSQLVTSYGIENFWNWRFEISVFNT
jgi:hypothetical protein